MALPFAFLFWRRYRYPETGEKRRNMEPEEKPPWEERAEQIEKVKTERKNNGPPEDMDPECVDLCNAINLHLPGVATILSDSGHGSKPYMIWMLVADYEMDLPLLAYFFSGHLSPHGCDKWYAKMEVQIPFLKDITFLVQGPTGKEAYREAKLIAKYIKDNASKIIDELYNPEEPRQNCQEDTD
jgi:hypothetical protein